MSLNLSENHHLRKCLLKKDQVPTQTQMLRKMQEPLGRVYFGSMTPKLKVIAGFEPPLQGGGFEWYMPPSDLLQGRAVLKPIKHEYLSKLGYKGIEFFSDKITREYRMTLAKEKADKLRQNDIEWKEKINVFCQELWEELSHSAAKRNTKMILEAFSQYTDLYAKSINQIEHLLLQAAYKEIEDSREKTYQKMMENYKKLLKDQAGMLYDRYTKKLEEQKEYRKKKFIAEVEDIRLDLVKQVHQIRFEKHVTIEKFRAVMECQNMACQLYVAMKEQQEHDKEVEDMKQAHKREVKEYKKVIDQTQFEIEQEKQKSADRQELNRIWRKKICKVVKSFQDFIGFCLNKMPEHADFFLDLEKLLLLQLDEAAENPEAESIIIPEEKSYTTPVPRPHPFYLICDKGYKPNIDADLCPKHCTSSASQMPVVIINNRRIYTACDNMTLCADEIEDFLKGNESDLEDDHSYTNDIPITHSPRQELSELKLESSLMQIIQKEIPNVHNVPVYCCDCHLPHCYLPSDVKARYCTVRARTADPGQAYKSYATFEEKVSDVPKVTRKLELEHEREPKIKSYLRFMRPQVCECYRKAKKHLKEHLPPYMVQMSKFEAPELPNYEACSIETLRKLVRDARNIREKPPSPEIYAIEYKGRDVGTQCEDEDYELLCACYNEAALQKFFTDLAEERLAEEKKTGFKVLNPEEMSTSHVMDKSSNKFAMEQALKLRKVVECPQIQEIFKRPNCDVFDK